MSENKFETVSALVDNYLPSDEQLADVLADEQLSDTWQRYHLIGDILRDETPQAMQLDLSADIANAIEQEPAILAPQSKPGLSKNVKAKIIAFAKPFGQMAIAASAAGLMVLGVQQNVAENEVAPSMNSVVQTRPFGGVADPVSFNYQSNDRVSQKQAYLEQQRRFQALLADHQQQVKLSSVTNQVSTQLPTQDEKVEDSNK